MRNFSFTNHLNKIWMIALVAFMVACSQFEAPGPDDVNLENAEELTSAFSLTEMNLSMLNARTEGGVDPVVIPGANLGGNRTCAEAAAEFLGEDETFEFSSPTSEPGGNNYSGGQFENSFPDYFNISVTKNAEGEDVISWSFESFIDEETGKKQCLKNLVVVVKGGGSSDGAAPAVGYFYNEGQTSDSGLQTLFGQGLSNLRLCYNLEDCPDDEPCFEWEGETAWADGPKYSNIANWFTYTPYNKYTGEKVTLFAGQTLEAGKVIFSTPGADGKVTITIKLNEGWRFADSKENVKIHGYNSTPMWNSPVLGRFAFKNTVSQSESTFTRKVDLAKFYGVHVDVEEYREVECPVEE